MRGIAMPMHQEIDALIAERESALRSIQDELAALRKVRIMLASGNGTAHPQDKLPREGSAIRVALDALKAAGRPMTTAELYGVIQQAGIDMTQESFFSGLYRAKNEGRWLKRTGRGEFGLLEWQ
jgi:hypothetical protein